MTGRTAPWASAANLALAREMWDAGDRVRCIAATVGTTHAGIVGHAHRWGWPPHPHQPRGAEWRAQRKATQAAPEPPEPEPRRKPVAKPAPAVAAPKPPRGPRREACNPEPLAVPTARFHGCQWLDGDDRRTWRFCDAPVGPQDVYCADHYGRCYYRPRWHAEVAA